MNTFGSYLKLLRKEEDLSQIEFSKRLLISQSYLSAMERGIETPNDKLVKLICLEFGVKKNGYVLEKVKCMKIFMKMIKRHQVNHLIKLY